MRVPFSLILLLQFQPTQLTHIFEGSQKEVAKDAERKKVLKDVAAAIAKEKGKAAEKKAKYSEKAWLVVENKLAESETRLGGMELKLAEDESLNLAHVDEIADQKVALKACENKWYKRASWMLRTLVDKVSWVRGGVVGGLSSNGSARGFPAEEPRANPLPCPFPPPPPSSELG